MEISVSVITPSLRLAGSSLSNLWMLGTKQPTAIEKSISFTLVCSMKRWLLSFIVSCLLNNHVGWLKVFVHIPPCSKCGATFVNVCVAPCVWSELSRQGSPVARVTWQTYLSHQRKPKIGTEECVCLYQINWGKTFFYLSHRTHAHTHTQPPGRGGLWEGCWGTAEPLSVSPMEKRWYIFFVFLQTKWVMITPSKLTSHHALGHAAVGFWLRAIFC